MYLVSVECLDHIGEVARFAGQALDGAYEALHLHHGVPEGVRQVLKAGAKHVRAQVCAQREGEKHGYQSL